MTKKKSQSGPTDDVGADLSGTAQPGNGAADPSSEPLLGARFEVLREEASEFAETVQETAHEVGAVLRHQMQTRPYTTLGMAAGAGFILGGGLSPRLTYALLGMGGRLVAARVLQEVLQPNA